MKSSIPLVATAACLSIAMAGCEMWLTPSVSPTVDIRGNAGFEGRVEFGVSLGAPATNAFLQVGPGGGYNQELGGYFVHESSVGMQFGEVDDLERPHPIRGRVAFDWSVRGGEHGLWMGPGGLLELLFGVARTRGPLGVFLIGPRLQVDGVLPDEGRKPNVVVMPAFVMQWVFGWFYGEPRRPPPVRTTPPP